MTEAWQVDLQAPTISLASNSDNQTPIAVSMQCMHYSLYLCNCGREITWNSKLERYNNIYCITCKIRYYLRKMSTVMNLSNTQRFCY